MSKWKEETRYGMVVGAKIRAGVFRLSVHHYIGCGEKWFASCDIFDRRELASANLSEAKHQAKAMLQVKLEEAINEIATA